MSKDTVELRNTMTEDEKFLHDELQKKCDESNEQVIKRTNEISVEIQEYLKGLLNNDIGDCELTAQFDSYATEVRIKSKDGSKWGNRFSIYFRDEHKYEPTYQTLFKGIEFSWSSNNVKSYEYAMEDIILVRLQAALIEKLVDGSIIEMFKKYFDEKNKMSLLNNAIYKPLEEMVKTITKRNDNKKTNEVRNLIKEGVVLKTTEGKYSYFHKIVKINKVTMHIATYRNGYLRDEKFRYNTEDFIKFIKNSTYEISNDEEMRKTDY